ncbi:MAG: FGGY family carbohydrate kinase [Eubacteriales bacterium]|nr:FGGY family carbohydrate kinase [Eubacteriales bacterium]
MAYLMAIDLGTTGCRSMVFDDSLRLLGADYIEYGLITPKPNWYEQDATLWWEIACRTMQAAIAKAEIDGKQIVSISVSSQGISVVPVDQNLQPLSNALSWMDTRAEEEERLLIAELGQEKTFLRTGKRIAATYTLPKLLWMQAHQPTIFYAADRFLMPLDFLTAKLTGRAVTDPSMASGTLLYNMRVGCWHQPTLQKYGIAEDQLAQILPSGSAAGTVLPDVAKKLGLSCDCIVCVGAQDQRCASLGAGLAPDVVTVSLGTAAAVCKLSNRFAPEDGMHVGWSPYVFSGEWVSESVAGAAGASLRWLRDSIYRETNYDAINREAQCAREKGSDVTFLPYLCGPGFPRFDPASTGCFHEITMATERGDLALAVMRGVVYQIREILESMDAHSETKRLVLFGGGVKSTLWRQLFADGLGIPVSIPENAETAGVGAAILAGLGAGVFRREQLPQIAISQVCLPSEFSKEEERQYLRFRALEQKLESGHGA